MCAMRLGVVATVVAVSLLLALPAAGQGGRRIANGGVSMAIPHDWKWLALSPPPPGNGQSEPMTRLVVASGAVTFGRGCNDIDYTIGSKAVAIVVLEWRRPTPGTTWPTRPRHFGNDSLPIRRGLVECWPGAGGSVQFKQNGRRLAAFILAGAKASTTTIATARHVLDTLDAR